MGVGERFYMIMSFMMYLIFGICIINIGSEFLMASICTMSSACWCTRILAKRPPDKILSGTVPPNHLLQWLLTDNWLWWLLAMTLYSRASQHSCILYILQTALAALPPPPLTQPGTASHPREWNLRGWVVALLSFTTTNSPPTIIFFTLLIRRCI